MYLFTEHILWGHTKLRFVYNTLLNCIQKVFFQPHHHNLSVQAPCKKQWGFYLCLLWTDPMGQGHTGFPLRIQALGILFYLFFPSLCSFNKTDASQKETRCQDCGRPLSSLSQAAGVGKREFCTVQPSPSDVFNVKKDAHFEYGNPARLERGLHRQGALPNIWEHSLLWTDSWFAHCSAFAMTGNMPPVECCVLKASEGSDEMGVLRSAWEIFFLPP